MAENFSKPGLKKVLIIAYSFPPAGGGRVRRTMKFVKFLPESGWETLVLTVKKPRVDEYDPDLIGELPGNTKIYRTPSLEPPRIKKIPAPGSYPDKPEAKGFFRKSLQKLKWFFFFPDSRVGWVPFCVLAGLKIIKREGADLIYVSGEPFSSFISGVILKKITKKPLILDFRDQWAGFSDDFAPDKPKLVKTMERFTEKFYVRHADRVISVTEPIIDNFLKTYKGRDPQSFVCITNGFDPDDFSRLVPATKMDNKFTVTYTGALYGKRSPEYFLKAAENLAIRRPEFKNNAKIVFIGSISHDIIGMFQNPKLNSLVSIRGFLTHRQSLEQILASDLLLYIEDQVKISNRLLPAKLFEYMASGKPILALANEGEVKRIVEYTGCGVVAGSRDTEQVEKFLERYYDNFLQNKKTEGPDKEKMAEFSRRNTAKKLALVFDDVAGAKGC